MHDEAKRTFRMAMQMQVNPQEAASTRCRFLYESMGQCLLDGSGIAMVWYWRDLEEALYLLETAPRIAEKSRYEEKTLDVESARAYPITELIDFNRGKAIAWCHCDTRPSLTYSQSRNTARCWVCNKSFGPIDVLMERDGMNFVEAVKYLTA